MATYKNPNSRNEGYFSVQPSFSYPFGSQAWHGAIDREKEAEKQRTELAAIHASIIGSSRRSRSKASSSTKSSDGSLQAMAVAFLCVVGFFAMWIILNPRPAAQPTSAVPRDEIGRTFSPTAPLPAEIGNQAWALVKKAAAQIDAGQCEEAFHTSFASGALTNNYRVPSDLASEQSRVAQEDLWCIRHGGKTPRGDQSQQF